MLWMKYECAMGSGQSDMKTSQRVDARAGDVGFICTPCIHNVENPSAAPSLSLHIFSHARTANATIELIEYPMNGTVSQPRITVSADPNGAVREYVLASCAEMIGAHSHPRSLPLLDRVLTLAQARARLVAVKAMSGLDPLHAADRACTLAEQVGGKLGDRLRQASETILQHV